MFHPTSSFDRFVGILLISLAFLFGVEAVDLNQDNWNTFTKGRSIFVKFYSKTCPHCQEIAVAWNKLADAWKNDETRIIGEVDCDVEKSLCKANEIKGIPTILYGDSLGLEEYGGKKDFKLLNNFVEKELVPVCSPNNISACVKEDKERIDEWMALPLDAVDDMIRAQLLHIDDAKKDFEQEMSMLQGIYDNLNQSRVLKIARIREDIKLIKSVKLAMR